MYRGHNLYYGLKIHAILKKQVMSMVFIFNYLKHLNKEKKFYIPKRKHKKH